MTLYAELKIKLLNHISKFQKQNFTEIKAFFILNNINFGNSMINILYSMFLCLSHYNKKDFFSKGSTIKRFFNFFKGSGTLRKEKKRKNIIF